MAKSKSFLQEAVVAAKEVREAAIQHAYKELEENLTPSIKEALAQKLEEDLDIEGLEESNGAVAGFKPVKEPRPKKEEIKEAEEEEETEETEETEEEETVEEPEEDTEVPEESGEDEDHEEVESDEEETEEHEEPSDDTELKDLTLGDLKELITSMVSAITPEKPAEQPEDMVPADVEGQGDEDTPIIPNDEEELDIDVTADETEKDGDEEEKTAEEDDVEINLDELLKELESEEHDRKVVTHKEDSEFQKELDEVKKQRDEALATIEEMKETVKGVNLLNAKLMCTTKLLSKPLAESQKTRAIRAFDEAQSAKEVKAIYKTLLESFNSEAKTKKNGLIREHKGSASRAAGKSTAAPIVEVDPMVRRFQQLAGIIQ